MKYKKKSVKLRLLRCLVPSVIIKKPRPNSGFGLIPKTTWYEDAELGLWFFTEIYEPNSKKDLCIQADVLPQTLIHSSV